MSEMKKKNSTVLRDFLLAFLVLVLINKIFMLYFGLNYAEHPGEGYGYGLVGSILFFLVSIGRFLWKYRNYEELQ